MASVSVMVNFSYTKPQWLSPFPAYPKSLVFQNLCLAVWLLLSGQDSALSITLECVQDNQCRCAAGRIERHCNLEHVTVPHPSKGHLELPRMSLPEVSPVRGSTYPLYLLCTVILITITLSVVPVSSKVIAEALAQGRMYIRAQIPPIATPSSILWLESPCRRYL